MQHEVGGKVNGTVCLEELMAYVHLYRTKELTYARQDGQKKEEYRHVGLIVAFFNSVSILS